jgi:hypothetical protein
MGRRSRQRGTSPVAGTPPAPAAPQAPSRHASLTEAPKAPWHPVPLVELAILSGIVLLVVGFVVGGDGGAILAIGGIVLVAIASLELAIREHFSGYRSHSALLAAVVAVGLMAGIALAGLPRVAAIAVGLAAGLLSFFALRRTFQTKSGGLAWRA